MRGCNHFGGPKHPPIVPIERQEGRDRVYLQDCPVNLIPARVWPLIRLYGSWVDGRFWRAGGLADQPHKYVQAMCLIGSEVAKIRAAAREKK